MVDEPYENVYQRLLAAYSTLQRVHTDDGQMTILDLASPGGFMEWFHAASEDETDGLLATTPCRLPVPVLALGVVSVTVGPIILILKSSLLHPELIDMALFFVDTNRKFAELQLELNDSGLLHTVRYDSLEDEPHAGAAVTAAVALCMFHVKNIVVSPRVIPRHVRRRVKRETGRDLDRVVYHTLTIRPFRQHMRGDSRADANGGPVPLHLVRGHFAHYSDDHPLFGKYPGTFWRPAHFAGNRNDGMSRKTYTIQPKG
jgi:hypothetical protein